jgi:hypothetical protein
MGGSERDERRGGRLEDEMANLRLRYSVEPDEPLIP